MIRKNLKIKIPMNKMKQNISGNFRGKEDRFFRAVRDGFLEFLKSPFEDK